MDKMKNEIDIYLSELIINSNIEDWKSDKYVKNNISIEKYLHFFEVTIWCDNNKVYDIIRLDFEFKLFCNVEERKRRRKLKQKSKEIKKFIENKNEYTRLSRIYNNLPISYIRKNKLKSIKTTNKN